MSYLTTNQHWLQQWLDQPDIAAKELWEKHSTTLLHRLQKAPSGSRLNRHIQIVLDRFISYQSTTKLTQRHNDHEALLYWIVFRAYEESFLPEGRERVHRRHFPTDGSNWRERANQQGALYLVAREFVSHKEQHASTEKSAQVCAAVELAEAWSQGQQIPQDIELEPFTLLVWYRRSVNIARQLVREDAKHWQSTQELKDNQVDEHPNHFPHLQKNQPEKDFIREESHTILRTIILAVTRDLMDEQILSGIEEGQTEQEIAEQLLLTRGKVRGRWNTLISRTRLLFKVHSQQQDRTPLQWEQTSPTEANQIRHQLCQVLATSKEQSIAISFWLVLFRLSLLLAQKETEAPDQPSPWNALSQTWRRATEKLLEYDASHPGSMLLRNVVSNWLEQARRTLNETSTLTHTLHPTLLEDAGSREKQER